jgi:hypothetical protein
VVGSLEIAVCVRCGRRFNLPDMPYRPLFCLPEPVEHACAVPEDCPGHWLPGDMRALLCPDSCFPAWLAETDQLYSGFRALNRERCSDDGHAWVAPFPGINGGQAYCARCADGIIDGEGHSSASAR